jgi:hypothetical protein
MLALFVSLVASQALNPTGLKVYRGKDGQRVEVVTLASEKGKTNALARVSGSGSERDGLVFRGVLERHDREGFVMKYGGKDWHLFDNRDGALTVYMPGLREFQAKYDEPSTKESDAAAVVKAHQAQLVDDSIAIAEKAEWPHLTAKYEKAATDAAQAISTSCGTPSSLALRWATFDDDTMANVNVWKLCAPLVPALQSRCAAVKARPRVVCQLGSMASVERLDGLLRITVTKSGVTTSWAQQELAK